MAHSDLPVRESDPTVETIATRLEATDADAVSVARAILATGDDTVVHQCGHSATALAALRIAWRRTSRGEIGLENACTRLGSDFEVDPVTVTRAEAMLESSIGSPASEEIKSLRRAIVAIHEVLAAIENDRVTAPRLSGPVFDDLDPSLAALVDQPLDRIDETELRAHLQRLEADLELARLGVELYAAVHDE